MWLEVLFREFIDVAQGEQVSRSTRIICTALVSLAFLIGIAGLFLLAFVIEGQSLLRKGVFLIVGLVILAYYLQFMYTVMGRKQKKR